MAMAAAMMAAMPTDARSAADVVLVSVEVDVAARPSACVSESPATAPDTIWPVVAEAACVRNHDEAPPWTDAAVASATYRADEHTLARRRGNITWM